MSLKIRSIERAEEFADLAPLWSELAAASGETSPFMSHDWFWCCWHALQGEERPEVLLMEDATGPVAIFPLMRWRSRLRGLPVRCLGFLACRDTFFTDVLALGQPEPVLEAFLQHLCHRSDWDVMILQKLPVTSATAKTLQGMLPGRLPWRSSAPIVSPYLTLSGEWESFFRSKTQRFRKTCRNIENRICRAGDIKVEEWQQVDPDETVFAEVMEVSRQSWKGPRGLAMATMSGMPRFFRDLTRRASRNGWLHLWILRLDGRAVATEYQIGTAGRLHALRADFDPSLAEFSPGAYLNARIIQALFEREGMHEYDMGPGTNEYKLRWASGTREGLALEVYAPTAYGRLLQGVETRLVPLARFVRDRLVSKLSAGKDRSRDATLERHPGSSGGTTPSPTPSSRDARLTANG